MDDYPWPTPTPRPTPDPATMPDLGFDEAFDGLFVEVGNEAVQTWNTANSDGGMDIMMTLVVIVVIWVSLRIVIRKFQEL